MLERSWIADKKLSDGSTVTISRIEKGVNEGLMLQVKGLTSSETFLPDILKQKKTTAGRIFKEINGSEEYGDVCDKINSL